MASPSERDSILYGGSFYDMMGANDQCKATAILIELFPRKLGQVRRIGVDDSFNDLRSLAVGEW